jgi:aconitate hydratase
MIRGTFANVRLRNELAAGEQGGMTRHFPSGEIMTVWDAAERYRQEGVPLVVLAGSEYGTGSSRDWAAKGTALLGVRAVIARSFERIHRSNLIGMGILPIQFPEGVSAASLGIHGNERFTLEDLEGKLKPGCETAVQAARPDGSVFSFHAVIRLDTPSEVDYYRHGGILPRVLRNLVRG